MIQILLDYGTEKVLIIVNGKEVRFGNTSYGAQTTTIEGLKLSYDGVCREFPDLETNTNWKKEAINRFKIKIESMDGEKQIADYLINDLKKFGYTNPRVQQKGFRTQKIKDGK